MTVGELLRAFARAMPPQDRPAHVSDARSLEVECTGVAYDSRRVAPGMVFVAVPGMKADGLQFVSAAIAAGAAAIVAEQPAPAPAPVPWVVVTSARLALALLAAEFFEHPSRAMRVVGITGTNGKTTTSYLLAAIFEAAGMRCGMMGTVTYRIGARSMDATRTTPEAPEVQSFMRRMVAEGCGACVMEVSSHALSLRRVDGVQFSARVFTNLTRDHLDFHSNMEDYFAAKRRLFEMAPAESPSIINLDDPQGTGADRRLITANHVRDQQAGRCSARSAVVLAGRPAVRCAAAAGRGARALAPGRPAQRLQHSRRRGDSVGARHPDRRDRKGHPPAARRSGPIRGGVHPRRRRDGGRRLRAHGRRPEKPARDRAPAGGAAADYGVRRRRRSRPHQAAADGHGGRQAERRRDHHVGQPARRGPACGSSRK